MILENDYTFALGKVIEISTPEWIGDVRHQMHEIGGVKS